MSCESWSKLVAQGERMLREGSPERRAAERHFRSCPSCAERAFLLDPSWAVRRGRHFDSSSESGPLDAVSGRSTDGAELADLKRKILEAGRMSEFEGSVRRAPFSIRAAAAAVLFAVLLAGGALFRTGGWPRQSDAPGRLETAARGSAPTMPAAMPDPLLFSAAAAELSLPAVGSLAPAAARVYDLGQEDFALVMVVHETLDL